MKNFGKSKSVLLALLVASTLGVVGCGSSNSGPSGPGGPQGPAPINPFAGNFRGNVNFGNGQFGTLNYSVGAGSQVQGNLQIGRGIAAQAISFVLPEGSFNLSGQIDPRSGSFFLTGLVGILPVQISGVAGGSFTVNIGGQTFTGQNSGGGNGIGGDQQLITSGTLTNFLFTGAGGFNGPTLGNDPLISGAITRNTATNNNLVISLSESEVNPIVLKGLTLGIFTAGADNVTVKNYPILTDPNGEGCVVSYTRNAGFDPTPTHAWVQGNGTTGSITVTAISQNQATLNFSFEGMVPNSEVQGNQAAGTLSTSGSLVVNFGDVI